MLFRAAQHSAALELELARRNIPFVKYGGLKFLEAAHVKDVLAVLRFAANPRGERAAWRALQLVPGIGTATAGRLIARMAEAPTRPRRCRPSCRRRRRPPPGRSSRPCSRRLRAPGAPWPEEHRRGRALVPAAARAAARRCRAARRRRRPPGAAGGRLSLARPLPDRAGARPARRDQRRSRPGSLDEDYLILSTIHSAKGQEWSAVSVLNVVDGCIPSDMATGNAAEIEEERRLLYVAMTRARHHLHLLVPQRFYVTQQASLGDRHMYAAISRFLPESIRDRFVHLGPAGARRRSRPAAAVPTPVDIGARVRVALEKRGAARRRRARIHPAPGRPKEKAAASNGPMLPLAEPRRFAAGLDLCAVVRSCRWRP